MKKDSINFNKKLVVTRIINKIYLWKKFQISKNENLLKSVENIKFLEYQIF